MHRVNKQYDAVLSASLTVTDSSTEPEWVQVYTGLARGLGNLNTNITACVEDGNITVAQFKAAFDAFENRRIFDGEILLIGWVLVIQHLYNLILYYSLISSFSRMFFNAREKSGKT